MAFIIDEDGVMMPSKVFVRTPHNYDMNEVSNETGLVCSADEDKAQQNFAEECDINTIVRRFGLTGQLPDNVRMPQYIDYEGVFDFQSAMNTMLEAEANFMAIPAEIRARFENDPQKFLEFCSDDKNYDEARKWGLVPPAPAPAQAPGAPVPAGAPGGAGAPPPAAPAAS